MAGVGEMLKTFPLISSTWSGKIKELAVSTVGPVYPPFHVRDLNIHRFWYPRGLLEPIRGYQETTVLLGFSSTSLISGWSYHSLQLQGSRTSHVVAKGSQSKCPKRDQQTLHSWPYLTCSWKAHCITSTVFCLLKLSKRVHPVLRGRDIVRDFCWKEGQRICRHVFKLPLRHQSAL